MPSDIVCSFLACSLNDCCTSGEIKGKKHTLGRGGGIAQRHCASTIGKMTLHLCQCRDGPRLFGMEARVPIFFPCACPCRVLKKRCHFST